MLLKRATKVGLLHRQGCNLIYHRQRMVSNVLIQSHFDNACPTWYSSQENLQKKTGEFAKQMYLVFTRTITNPADTDVFKASPGRLKKVTTSYDQTRRCLRLVYDVLKTSEQRLYNVERNYFFLFCTVWSIQKILSFTV